MIINCTCGAKLKIGDDKLTESGVRIKCPKCGTIHVARRPAPAAVEPAMPWFAQASSVAPKAPPAPAPKAVQPPSAPPSKPVQATLTPAPRALQDAPQDKPPDVSSMPWFASASSVAPEAPPVPASVPKPASAPVPVAKEPAPGPAMPWFASASNVAPQEPVAPAPAPQTMKPAPAPAPKPVQPASAPQPKPVAAATPVRTPVPASELVLVAHDSKVVADMIQGVVSAAGLTVEHATDGLDALKKATVLKPRVMIVDVGLTGIYGFELCERLKGDPETRSIKIILLSSVYGLTAYKRNPVTLYGADDYIEKHHIPDRLLPKLMELLSGRAAVAPVLPPAHQQRVDDAVAEPIPAPQRAEALVPERSPAARAVPPAPEPSTLVSGNKFAVPEVPDVMPKVPVTLDTARKRVAGQASTPVTLPPRVEKQVAPPPPVVPAVAEPKEPPRPVAAKPSMKDESISLDASFFEQDEYEAPAKSSVKSAADPEEIEKARRFARLVVSDIALYNQETVTEGIAKGTFYELLNEDITEGRALYEKRVPEAIRATKDYYQEAFDNFIAAKKKQR